MMWLEGRRSVETFRLIEIDQSINQFEVCQLNDLQINHTNRQLSSVNQSVNQSIHQSFNQSSVSEDDWQSITYSRNGGKMNISWSIQSQSIHQRSFWVIFSWRLHLVSHSIIRSNILWSAWYELAIRLIDNDHTINQSIDLRLVNSLT